MTQSVRLISSVKHSFISGLFLLILFQQLQTRAITGHVQTYGIEEGIIINYEDLVNLSKTDQPEGELLEKLKDQLNTPIINQPQSEPPQFLHGNHLGKFFRVASWNIERGFNLEQIEKLFDMGSFNVSAFQEQKNILSKSSIVILEEVDIGVPRTAYQNIVQKLANSLKMGYVFGTEFLELDPYQLGIKKFSEEERNYLEPAALAQIDNLDKENYHGLHGVAILTKYPIINARIIRLPDCYDWYKKESEKISALEKIKRNAAQKVFSEKVLTELRRGGRIALVADLQLPNKQKITVIATHLENRCLPECRTQQVEFLLNQIKSINNPIILAGDFNTTGTDASPTSVKKEVLKKVKDPAFIAKQAILAITPVTFVQNVVLNTANTFKNYKDPTTKHIPILFPNKERKTFDLIEDFMFNDGNTFDFRGVSRKTHKGNTGLLSNSNERDTKGFKTTFELERNFGVAKYKLDWFFVKPLNLKDSNDKNDSYAYAPHFGRTLDLANRAFGNRISDHDPITIDIPIADTEN